MPDLQLATNGRPRHATSMVQKQEIIINDTFI